VDHKEKPGTPGDILEHHGVKGQKWGVRNEDKPSVRTSATKAEPLTAATRNQEQKQKISRELKKTDIPDLQDRVRQLTRTDHPQVLKPRKDGTVTDESGKVTAVSKEEKHGLTKNQKMLLAFGAVAAAGAGYYAYQHYTGNKMPGALPKDILKESQQVKVLDRMTLPKSWDVSKLKEAPISQQRLGDLAGGERAAKLLNPENLVVNTSRGYADILPKDGFSNPFAAEQHESAARVLEAFRDKYPAIRNMNIELMPMSAMEGMSDSGAHMCVLPMRAGEARLMYNDTMSKPDVGTVFANRKFLPGLKAKDYVAQHEMGHLLAVAHGELPPAFQLLKEGASPSAWNTRQTAEPLMHQKMFLKHGFTYKELSKISGYAATQPAEAMAELAGHYHNPEMQKRLTPDQVRRAKAMFDEMGGVT
jgi:hypothetical protein